MDQELPSHLQNDAFDTSQLASEDKLDKARKLALEYAVLEIQIEALQGQIDEKTKRRNELQQLIIPQFFDQSEIGAIELPGCVSRKFPDGVKIAIAPHYHANIKADWPEEQRERAYAYLEKEGHGGLVRGQLVVTFSKGELEDAREIEKLIRDSKWGNRYVPKIEMSVQWNTLTALVKSEIEQGRSVDLETLGAKIIRQAKITKLRK